MWGIKVLTTTVIAAGTGLPVIIHTSNYKVTGRVQCAHTDGDDWTYGVTDGNGGLN